MTAAVVLTSASRPPPGSPFVAVQAPQAPQAIFRSAVEVVTVSAAVRNSKAGHPGPQAGRFRGLRLRRAREINDFYFGDSPDQPGHAARHQRQHGGGRQHGPRPEGIAWCCQPARQARTRRRSSPSTRRCRKSWASPPISIPSTASSLEGKPWGITSLFDAIGAAARRVAERTNKHRALLVITDGVDTGSKLTAPQVSGIASSIDVPVYLLAVVNPVDHPEGEFQARPSNTRATGQGALADLSRWTGGDAYSQACPATLRLRCRPVGGAAPSVPHHLRAWGAAWMASRSKSGRGRRTWWCMRGVATWPGPRPVARSFIRGETHHA